MSDLRRIITGYIDTENGIRQMLRESTFFNPAEMNLTVSQQILFRFHLMLADATTYFQPPADATWYFGINDAYTPTVSDDVIQVGNDNFIAADWVDSNFSNGKICWRVDLTDDALVTKLGTAASKTFYCGLWMTPSGGKPTPIAEWEATIKNVATYVVSPTKPPGISFVTTDMLSSYMRKKEPYMDTAFSEDGLMYKYCTDDSLWYPIAVRLVGGKPTLVVGETGVESI